MKILKGPVNQLVTVAGKTLLSSLQGVLIATLHEAPILKAHGFEEIPGVRAAEDPQKDSGAFGTIWHNVLTDKIFLRLESEWKQTTVAEAHKLLAASAPEQSAAGGGSSGTPSPTLPPEEEDDICLLGSSVQPAIFKLSDGSEVQLGTVVQEAFKRSGLKTSREWNQRAEAENETAIAAVVEELKLADTVHKIAEQAGT